ncbi:NADH-quinone oxidoreductase subunit A [Halobacteriovorax marinus]|uniref:NADH-quinone oxidoreductase subunit A n=1 Tax=Halobacteriovorax marinus (strain ATCC BAA-682 / DSM 15412 / SJ) TaxID=862908 RepID=E1X1P7_HALMS|nr:NADH-quinone oxidoreductase subunit A [Halobacteriovorax marinus]ATH06403.1 NADH-quinone oxidoreductase subunit A [Halobacteriovorax marinus]CBW24966.1 NADH dehydrogenase I chain A [Halobacteriovorax marinus SJ]
MSSFNLDVYMPVLILVAFAVVMVVGALVVGILVRPNNPNDLKLSAYECGEEPVGTAWSNFNIRFYVIALIFIIFDVEGALMFPVAVVFKKFNEIGEGTVVFASLLLFISILIEGVVYCWKKGDLDWVRSYQVPETKKEEVN